MKLFSKKEKLLYFHLYSHNQNNILISLSELIAFLNGSK